MSKAKPKLGSITFRLDEALHRELLDLATTLGTDLSGFLKVILAEALPTYRERATAVRLRNAAAEYGVPLDQVRLVEWAIGATLFPTTESDRVEVMRKSLEELGPLDAEVARSV